MAIVSSSLAILPTLTRDCSVHRVLKIGVRLDQGLDLKVDIYGVDGPIARRVLVRGQCMLIIDQLIDHEKSSFFSSVGVLGIDSNLSEASPRPTVLSLDNPSSSLTGSGLKASIGFCSSLVPFSDI